MALPKRLLQCSLVIRTSYFIDRPNSSQQDLQMLARSPRQYYSLLITGKIMHLLPGRVKLHACCALRIYGIHRLRGNAFSGSHAIGYQTGKSIHAQARASASTLGNPDSTSAIATRSSKISTKPYISSFFWRILASRSSVSTPLGYGQQ